MSNPLAAVERTLVGDIYTSREVMDNLEVLCDDFGSRWAGSAEDRLAQAFILQKLEAYGLRNVHPEPFQYVGWERGPATLRIIAPVERDLPCISLPMCPPSDLECRLVVVGDGAPAEFEAVYDTLPGSAAMVCSRPPRGLNRTLHRSEKYQRSALGGAAAFVYVNQYEAYGPETGSIAFDRQALIPGIGVSKETGDLLTRLQRRHGPLTLRITTTDRCAEMTTANLVGELPGQSNTNDWVLVGCHYDGHDISQGAHDPMSGAVAVLEAARVLSAHASDLPGCGIRFVLFGVEETGLIGAHRYVKQHLSELDHIRFMLNLDAAGGPGPKGLAINRWPELTPFFERCAADMAADVPTVQKTSAFSDHYPFFLEGVPTAMMGNPGHVNTGRGYDHTMWDTVDKVQIQDMREAAAVAARLALRMSREDPWPARRRSASDVEALMAAEPSLEGRVINDAMEALYGEVLDRMNRI